MKPWFIGSEIKTVAENTYTIIGSEPKIKDKEIVYLALCSICSKDTEMFPDPFKIRRSLIKRGCVSCGCSKSKRLNEKQQHLLVSRYCETSNIKFLGFSEGFRGGKTKCTLVCEKGHTRKNTTITNLLRGGGGCVTCRNNLKPTLKTDSEVISQFNYPEGTTFKRSPLGSCYWEMYCPVCSEDEYVVAGVCTGVFTSWVSNLVKGNNICRCGSGYRWSQEQREYQITKVCAEENLTFTGWEGEGYLSGIDKFKWVCEYGHKCTTSVNKFLYTEQRCRTCAENVWGFYKHKKEELDNLYILIFSSNSCSERFIKIGRAFNLNKRLTGFPKHYSISVLSTLALTHEEVYKMERELHKDLCNYSHKPSIPFYGHTECYNENVLYCSNNTLNKLLKRW